MKKTKDWEKFILTERIKNSDEELMGRLKFPERRVDVVIDTDAYNEIDDQFAVAYLLKNKEKLNTKALYAAPFYNDKSNGPGDGMEKSYNEIFNLLKLMNLQELNSCVYRGSMDYLIDEDTPQSSKAAEDLAQRAMAYTSENPLYVVSVGAITNIASAILLNPKITDRIVIVWLGGNGIHWIDNREFNSYQDVAADRVVFGSGAAVVQLPCMGVVSSFTIGKYDLVHHLENKNPLCDYLLQHSVEVAENDSRLPTWSRAIWDVTAVAWLVDDSFTKSSLRRSPIFEYDNRYAFDDTRHLYRYVYQVERDQIFHDLFKKLGE